MGMSATPVLMYGFIVQELDLDDPNYHLSPLRGGEYPDENEFDDYNTRTELIEIRTAGHCDYPYWVVCISDTIVEKYDYVSLIDLPENSDTAAYDTALKEFSKEHNLPMGDLGWLLAADYG